ncbi:hypothetical protein MCOR27_007581 [Pyricularia oryzae]|uniref:DNA mismatch repair protein S5 domain-containing protein n=3 Tax=Pyricularia TaxID=48558 RepID=A0ABQ8NDK8_PYRGI|nr:hypothetical protein MCOR27_007581 [Pyricularia oryzae]KAI6295336.1 hypothetical protein MCOR33_007730 [Pyricularia grisea]KAI6278164.1 hypothetical protein MCOR26_004736 [Pyricularia oryzae]KAI6346842.1 hypothetical protein MCOR28_002747 [Pyricularia oryzae]KAI6354580.1 hypothetical protein MCOR32_010502 [Pyricularia oryzae]
MHPGESRYPSTHPSFQPLINLSISLGSAWSRDDTDQCCFRLNCIQALSQDVVNKIAAGEIIVAPVHALKELIENAVDAGSTSLEVLCRDGGLKMLQITDNGCGIEKEDLPILCERFTTSKLQTFEDLSSIATYGFRGEALASISYIAHLTVTTKTKDSSCAWRAYYEGGKLAPTKPGQPADPKPVAGRQGTQITVEDLFYNVPSRRRAFRSFSDEYNKIIDMVGRYAVHCKGVAFSCKKHGESTTSIAVQAGATVSDRIRQIYGSSVANELIDFSTSDTRWGFKASGWCTNANHSVKKTTLLLFINNRCVESTNVKKSLEQTYAAFLPKNGHPFLYLSLEIDPQRVDVNVHPTKREVNFLNENEIIQAICENLRTRLAAVDTSRTFRTQTLLPAQDISTVGLTTPTNPRRDARAATASSAAKKLHTPARQYENNLVRTDTNARKITSMFAPVAGSSRSAAAATVTTPASTTQAAAASLAAPEAIEYETLERGVVPIKLASVKELRSAVREDMHHGLTDIFANHTFVGIVDERRRLAAIQGGVKLYLVDYGRASFEYFYQLGLTDFGNMGAICFSPPLDIRELIRVAAEREMSQRKDTSDETMVDVDEIVEKITNQLTKFGPMLLEYFNLEVTPTGELVSIPLLVKGYTPPIVKLPQFLFRLGPHNVDWTDEKACFESILRELASFYVPEQLPPTASIQDKGADENEAGDSSQPSPSPDEESEIPGTKAVDQTLETRRREVRWAVEHIIFPAFKARLVATNTLMKSGVLEVANLKGLYRVFERC